MFRRLYYNWRYGNCTSCEYSKLVELIKKKEDNWGISIYPSFIVATYCNFDEKQGKIISFSFKLYRGFFNYRIEYNGWNPFFEDECYKLYWKFMELYDLLKLKTNHKTKIEFRQMLDSI